MNRKIICILLLSVLALAAGYQNNGNAVDRIKFSLGKNIVETAMGSGIPEFSVTNVDEYIDYAARPLPATLPLVFTKPGYEITLMPAFSLVLNADRRRTPNAIVSGATIRMANKKIQTHVEGQMFVENLVHNFNKGMWKRHIPTTCPAVSGRSSFLDLAGNMSSTDCAIDPNYRFKPDEWKHLFAVSQRYQWLGGGVIATISAGYDEDIRGITYNIVVTFEDHKTLLAINLENQTRSNKEGDAKGWKSTAEWERDMKLLAANNKQLEENAVKRGDSIVPR